MNGAELQGATILIVDDQPNNLGVLFNCFHQLGCTVLLSESGEDALEIAKENRPDIILLDILMPGIGGFEACRRLKDDEDTQEIPLLFISSLSETVDKVRAFELGGVDFITKPFQTEEVLARVSTQLAYHKLKQELEQKNRRLQEEIIQHQATEQALQKARDAADSANRAKSVFISNMSHELRTPLNGVLGYAQLLLKDDNLVQQQKDALATIRKSGEHLLALIDEILEFSKIETQKVKLALQPFHLPELLYSIADTTRSLAFHKGLRFTVEIAPDLPLMVRGDKKRIHQILLNILNNAVKFTTSGSVEFRAGAKRWTQKQSGSTQRASLHFLIKDSGIGIPEHQLSRIFEPFKTSGDQYTQATGTGLSLAVSQHFVRMMGGEIVVESIAGEGTTFHLNFELEESPLKEAFEDINGDSHMAQSYRKTHSPETLPSETQIPIPPVDDLDVLRQYVVIGDIMAIRTWVREMRTADERLHPFIDKIDLWAQDFDIGNLQTFLGNIVDTKK